MCIRDSLIEKSDFADTIVSAERKAVENGSHTHKLLRRPSLLARQGEILAKAALRLSLQDAQRTSITHEELAGLTFSVRLRGDGPLAQAIDFDPWWQGVGSGKAQYHADGRITFSWPPSPDDGEPMNPFEAMGMAMDGICLLYTSPSPRDRTRSRMPSSA